MVGNAILDAESAEPAIGEVHPHLAAERALGADGEDVAEDEHSDEEDRIDRPTAGAGIVGHQLEPHPGEVENAVDLTDKVVGWHGRVEVERVKQLALVAVEPSHHRPPPPMIIIPSTRDHASRRRSTHFCNNIGQ